MAEWLKAQALVETTVAAPVSSASFANPEAGKSRQRAGSK